MRPKPGQLVLALAAAALAGTAILWLQRSRPRRRCRVPGPITQSMVYRNPADNHLGEPGNNREERLDEGLEESFPASDPLAMHIE